MSVWYTIDLPSVTTGGNEAKYRRGHFVLCLTTVCDLQRSQWNLNKQTDPDYMGLKIGLHGLILEGKYSDIYLCTSNP